MKERATTCPKMLGKDLCESNDKVKLIDKKVVEYFGVEEKTYVYQDIVHEINIKMTEPMMDDICSSCKWYSMSACKRNILG